MMDMKGTILAAVAVIFLLSSPGWGFPSPVKVTAVHYATRSPKGRCSYDISYPRLSGMADTMLQGKLNGMLRHEFMPGHMERDEALARDSGGQCTVATTFRKGMVTASLVSLAMKTMIYVPHARPGREYKEFTLDLKTGHNYAFSEIFLNGSPFKERIKDLVIRDATRQRDGNKPSYPPIEIKGRDFGNLDYYLTPRGLVIVNLFDENVAADMEVVIPYEKIGNLLKPGGPVYALPG
jgi:hypothetical protein